MSIFLTRNPLCNKITWNIPTRINHKTKKMKPILKLTMLDCNNITNSEDKSQHCQNLERNMKINIQIKNKFLKINIKFSQDKYNN